MRKFIGLTLPPSLTEDQIQTIAENCGDDILAIITERLDSPAERPWRIKWLVVATGGGEIQLGENDFKVEEIDDTIDWVARSLENFKPFTIGSFLIFGTHSRSDLLKPEINKPDLLKSDTVIPLQIDATTAFGTGQHPTTEGCLKALEYLKARKMSPGQILDMGAGTAILAIAAAKIWPQSRTTAIDIDPDSIRVAREQISNNDVDHQIQAFTGDGFQAPEICQSAGYDLVLANILAKPLRHMAADLCLSMKPGGFAVLSGLLQAQEENVLNTYLNCGLKLEKRFPVQDWSTLVLEKPLI